VSYFDFLFLWFSNMPDIDSYLWRLKRCMHSIRLWQPNFVWNISVYPLRHSSFSGKRWNSLFY